MPHIAYTDNLDGPRLEAIRRHPQEYYPELESVTAFQPEPMGQRRRIEEESAQAVRRDLSREKFCCELDKIKDFLTQACWRNGHWTPADQDGVKVAVAGFVNGKPTVLKAWGQRL